MCTSIIVNGNKTIVGWNLDLLDMEYMVKAEKDKVYIAVNDKIEGWLPLFGANNRGDFVAMPTCWPFDERSNPTSESCKNIIILNIDLLLGKKTLSEIKEIVENEVVCSVPGLTFQSQLSDKEGNSEEHPWMGWDRYCKAEKMLEHMGEDFDVSGGFEVLKSVAQTECPTVVSMVFDVQENVVYWCENRAWNEIKSYRME